MEDSLEELVEKCTSQKLPLRISAYKSLIQKCTESKNVESKNVVWSDYASMDDTQKTLSNLEKDLFSENNDVAYEAAGLCGCLLSNDSFVSLMSKEAEEQVVDVLLKAIEETKEKKLLTRTLWSLGRSKLNQEVYSKKLSNILKALLNILEVDESSSVSIYEALQVIHSLMEVVPKQVVELVKEWYSKVFAYLFHDAPKVRQAAYTCINTAEILMKDAKIDNAQKIELTKSLIPDLKTKQCKQLNRLISEEHVDILREWRLIVQILGRELHPGTSLVNGLLEVVERAFKSPKTEIRIEAFKSWEALINNFSLEESVLTNPKRLKLLNAPLKSNNAKTEEIAQAKLLAWWHLVRKLGKKATVNFDIVVAPLMRFCFGCGSAGGAASGLSERNLIMSGAAASPGRKFSGLHVTSAEILAQILSTGLEESTLRSPNFTTPLLEHPVLPNQTVFIRHHQLLMECVKQAVQTLNSRDKKQQHLGLFLFQSTLAQIKGIIIGDSSKKESVEPVKECITMISALENLCAPGDDLSLFVYKFLEMVIVGSLALPKSVLNSRQYHISTGNTMRDMMSGTLSNCLIQKLCKPTFLHYATVTEGYFTMWLTVLENSKPATGKLGLLQAVIKELDGAAPMLCPAHPNTLTRLWSTVVQQLLQHINETQVIDQGDNTEHDWSCIYSVLLFPLRHSVDALNTAEAHVYYQVMKDWTELWHKFTELTPLSSTAEPNSEVEHLTRELVTMCTEKLTAPPDVYANTFCIMADVLAIITNSLRYSELGKSSVKTISSPAKPRKKTHPLHNLAGTIALIGYIFPKVLRMVSNQRNQSASKLCDALVNIFQGVFQEKIINQLILSVVSTLAGVLQVNPAAKFGAEVEKKIINMFKTFSTFIENHVGQNHTGEQFAKMVPLLTVALSSSNKHVKQEAKRLWNHSFAQTKHDIPEKLFELLKECGLPPASLVETQDDFEDSLTLSPKENVPTHIAGSFLNRDSGTDLKVTPKSKLQKMETPKSGKIGLAMAGSKEKSKRKIDLQDMKDEDFVKVSSPQTKRRVLTEHQIEKMTARNNDIPALYSDLSQTHSQLVLPSQFSSQNSFEESSSTENKKIKNKGKDSQSRLDLEGSNKRDSVHDSFSSMDETHVTELSFKGKILAIDEDKETGSDNNEKPKLRTYGKKKTRSEKSSKQMEEEEEEDKEKQNKAKDSSLTTMETSKNEDKAEKKSVSRQSSRNNGKKDESSEIVEENGSKPSLTRGRRTKSKGVEQDHEESKTSHEESKTSHEESKMSHEESKMSHEESKTSHEEPKTSHEKAETEDESVSSEEEGSNQGDKKSKGRRYVSGESDYTDEDLDEELRRTSLVFQKSLDDSVFENADSSTSEKVLEESTTEHNRRKSQTPVKKTVQDIRNSLKGSVTKSTTECTPDKSSKTRKGTLARPKVNFGEVFVSPSVVKDKKIVQQVAEVKLQNECDQKNKEVEVSDSEDEIPSSQEEEPSNNRLSILSLHNKVVKSRIKEDDKLPGNKQPQEEAEGRRVLRAKRKRDGSQGEKESVAKPEKRKKVENITEEPKEKGSSEESVIIIEESITNKKAKLKEEIEIDHPENEKKYNKKPKRLKTQSEASRRGSQNSQNSEVYDSDEIRSTPPKVTRFGRKVVAPNKDMPEPMTPPGSGSQKRKPKLSVVNVEEEKVEKVKDRSSESSKTVRRSVQKKITDLFSSSQDSISDKDNSIDDEAAMDDDALQAMNDSDFEDAQEMDAETTCVTVNDTLDTEIKDGADEKEELPDEQILDDGLEEEMAEVSEQSEQIHGGLEEEIADVSQQSDQILHSGLEEEIADVSVQSVNKTIISESEEEIQEEKEEMDEEEKEEMDEDVKEVDNDIAINDEGASHDKSKGEVGEKEVEENVDENTEKDTAEDEEIVEVRVSDSKENDILDDKSDEEIEVEVEVEKSSENRSEEEKSSENRSEEETSVESLKSETADESSKQQEKELEKTEEESKVSTESPVDEEKCDQEPISTVNGHDVKDKEVEALPKEASPSPRKDVEEWSPEKPARSKLSTAMGTPERQKKFGGLKCAGSRAAMLVACARKNMKNRSDSPTNSCLTGETTKIRFGGSPSRRSAPGRMSPANTPPNRKRKFGDSDKPWMKHEPSPGASPSLSILKKPASDEGCEELVTSPPSKQRRVSFADPPVSDRVEIPPSPKTLKSMRAQKRLDMTKAASPMKDNVDSQSQTESQEVDSQMSLDCSQPLYPALLDCSDDLDVIISELTAPGLVNGLKKVLEDLGVNTVGQLCRLTEADVNKLPVRAPKVAGTRKVIQKYDESRSRESKEPTTTTAGDEVEAKLSQMFGMDGHEDKENEQPNNQHQTNKNKEEDRQAREGRSISPDLPSGLQEDDLDMEEDITPLDPSPDAVEPEPVAVFCKHVSQNPQALEALATQLDTEGRKILLRSLIQEMSYPSVIDCYYEYLKSRECSGDS